MRYSYDLNFQLLSMLNGGCHLAKQIETHLSIDVTVDFELIKERKSFYSKEAGAFQPDEKATIEIKKVTLSHNTKSIDITSLLTKEQFAVLEMDCWEYLE